MGILQKGDSVRYMSSCEGHDTKLERYRYLSLRVQFTGGSAVQAVEFTPGRDKEKVAQEGKAKTDNDEAPII